MALIVPGQYTTLGLDTPVPGTVGRRYLVTLTPQYEGAGRLSLGMSDGAALWDETLTVAGEAVDGTLALLATTRRIGGFLTRFFLIVGALASLAAGFGVRAPCAGNWRCRALCWRWCSALGFCTALCCRRMPRRMKSTTSTRALRSPAAGPTLSAPKTGAWATCPLR